MISLNRPDFLPLFGKCRIFVDDKHVANLRRCKQTVELNTDEGQHEIYFKCWWFKSNTLRFETNGTWHFFSVRMLYKFFKEEHELIIKEENKVQGKKNKKKVSLPFLGLIWKGEYGF